MATERQTLLTSSSRRTAPLQAERTDARGAFGDYSGVVAAGRALQSVGQDVNQVHSVRMQAIRQEEAKRFNAGFSSTYEVVATTELSKYQRDVNEQRAKGLSGTALDEYTTKRHAEAAQSIAKAMSESTVAKAFPDLYAKVATPEFFEAGAVKALASELGQNQVFTQTLFRSELATNLGQSIGLRFSKVSDAEQALELGVTMSKELNEAKSTLSAEQIAKLDSLIGRNIASYVRGLADNKDPRTLKMVEKAAKYGWVDNEDRRYVNHALAKEEPLKTTLARQGVDKLGEQFEKGVSLESDEVKNVTRDTVRFAVRNGIADGGVGKLALSQMIGSDSLLPNAIETFGVTYTNIGTIADQLSNPADPRSGQFVELIFSSYVQDTVKTLPEAERGSLAPAVLSAQDRAQAVNALVSRLRQAQEDISTSRGPGIIEGLFPHVKAARASGDVDTYLKAQASAVSRFNIPRDKFIPMLPEHAGTLDAVLTKNDPNSIGEVVNTLNGLVETYGHGNLSTALMNLARNKNTASAAMAMGYVYRRSFGELGRADSLIDANNIYAVSRLFSEQGKALMSRPEISVPVENITSSIFSGDLLIFGRNVSKDSGLKFSNTSLLAQGASQAGLTGPLETLTKAIALDALEKSNNNVQQAYNQTKQILSSMFAPVVTNGMADAADTDKVVQLIPTYRNRDLWYMPGTIGATRHQTFTRNFSKALDSRWFARRPNFSDGLLPFASEMKYRFDMAFARVFGGIGVGFNPERGRLSMAFVSDYEDTANLMVEGVDVGNKGGSPYLFRPLVDENRFSNIGVLDASGKFASVNTYAQKERYGVPHLDIPESVVEQLRSSEGDPDSKAQLILQNARVAWVYNQADNLLYAQVPSSGASAGFMGRLNNLGPNVQLMVKQPDGSTKPLTLPVDQVVMETWAISLADSWNIHQVDPPAPGTEEYKNLNPAEKYAVALFRRRQQKMIKASERASSDPLSGL